MPKGAAHRCSLVLQKIPQYTIEDNCFLNKVTVIIFGWLFLLCAPSHQQVNVVRGSYYLSYTHL